MTRVYLFKYEIDSETYWYGQRKDGHMGVMKSTDDLSMDVIHMMYSVDTQEGEIPTVPLVISRHYELVGRIINDLVANNMYDRCDVSYDETILFNNIQSFYNVNVSFLHDDFCITNSREHKYFIKGLLSTIRYRSTDTASVSIYNVKGARTKVTYIDTHFGYKQSHLHSGLSKSNYCLGNSELRDRTERNVSINELDVFYDLMILDSFVQWESIEGGPYMLIYNLFRRIDVTDSTASVTLTEELIDTLDIKLSYHGSTRMFNSTAKTVRSTTPIDVRNDTDVNYVFKNSNTTGVSRQWVIDNYLKDVDSFDIDQNVYFKGLKPIEKVAFTEEEVNEMLNSFFVKKSMNIASIVNIINTTINNDVFRPTCSQEVTV